MSPQNSEMFNVYLKRAKTVAKILRSTACLESEDHPTKKTNHPHMQSARMLFIPIPAFWSQSTRHHNS